jgi:hypothetical protein
MYYFVAEVFCYLHDLYYQDLEKEEKEKKVTHESAHSFVYYFAYGASMNQAYLEKKIGPVEFVGKAALQGYRLSFAKPLISCPHVRATIIPNSQSFTEGAVYKINHLQLGLLDIGKRTNTLCQRIRLYVKQNDTSLPIPVELHMFDLNIGMHYQQPSPIYFAKILKGAKEIGVSQQYMRILWQHEPFALTSSSKL